MGEIKKILAMTELPYRKMGGAFSVNLCENIQFGYRNIRLDLSHDEWARYRAAMHGLGLAAEEQIEKLNHREGNPNLLVSLTHKEIPPPDSAYYPNRLVVEEQKNGMIHVHYRDLRLEMDRNEWEALKKAIAASLPCGKEPLYAGHDIIEKEVSIDDIQPYNDKHKPLCETNEVLRGIDHAAMLLREGKELEPVAVDSYGIILDGFERHMAHVKESKETIKVRIHPHGLAQCQRGHDREAKDV